MIPKIIHYCWFGRNPKSRLIEKCMQSWKRYCPDYEIREWNEDTFDVKKIPYVYQAYTQKKWAFVSDYVRFYALNLYGGIYLDTDVQILRPIDSLVEEGKFVGFANNEIVATGLIMATEPNDWLCQKVLESYKNTEFVWCDDPAKVLAIGRRVTGILCQEGLKQNGELQCVKDYTIYPKYYFNPTDGDVWKKPDERAYSIHHYAATWFTGYARLKQTIRRHLGSNWMKKYYRIKFKCKTIVARRTKLGAK